MHPYLSNVLSFLLMIFFFGFCVFIHEFGHLLAGLWRKLHVERFSLGFGNALWKREYKGVEYRISWIPVGGYVALPQLEPVDEPETFDGRKLPPGKPVDRIITAFAGPLFNLLSAFAIATVVWAIGMDRPKPMKRMEVAQVPTFYELADGTKKANPEVTAIKPGDVIAAINGTPVDSFRKIMQEIITAPHRKVKMDIIRDGQKMQVEYVGQPHPDPRYRGATGVHFRTYANVIAYRVTKGSPAETGGLQEGDFLLEVNGKRVIDDIWVLETLHDLNSDPTIAAADVKAATFKIRRDGKELTLAPMKPELKALPGSDEKRWLFGLQPNVEMVKYHPTPMEQVGNVFAMMGKTISVVRDLGPKVLGGPVGIAHRMTQSFSIDMVHGLHWVVLISVSLAVFNLLPLPVLDGGHIAIAVIELIVRRRMPARIMRPVSYVFFSMLICLILFVTYYDTRDLVGGSGRKKDVPAKVQKSDRPASSPAGKEKGEAPAAKPADAKAP